MEIWQAIILGIVQGLAEFLPISSSAHLLVVQEMLGVSLPNAAEDAFDVALHVGTLVALIAYFREDLTALLVGFIGTIRSRSMGEPGSDGRLAWLIALGTIPAVAAYALLEPQIQDVQDAGIAISLMMILFSGVFFIAEHFKGTKQMESVRWPQALMVGIAQACAFFPGMSRSGATTSMGMLLGMDRSSAARFSFLLSAPIVLAGVLATLDDLFAGIDSEPGFLAAVIAGMIASLISGYLAISGLLRFVRGRSLGWFALYRVPVGIIFLLYFMNM